MHNQQITDRDRFVLRRTRPRRRELGLVAASATFALGLEVVLAGTGLAGTGLAATQHSSAKTVIVVVKNKTWGSILALSNGDTVYRFTKDKKDKSLCSGACAKAWPPVLLGSGQSKPVGNGVQHLSTIARQGGAKQVTYEGIPLYTYSKDKAPGQVNGNIKDEFGQWWVLNPAHPMAVPVKKSTSSTTTIPAGGGVAY